MAHKVRAKTVDKQVAPLRHQESWPAALEHLQSAAIQAWATHHAGKPLSVRLQVAEHKVHLAEKALHTLAHKVRVDVDAYQKKGSRARTSSKNLLGPGGRMLLDSWPAAKPTGPRPAQHGKKWPGTWPTGWIPTAAGATKRRTGDAPSSHPPDPGTQSPPRRGKHPRLSKCRKVAPTPTSMTRFDQPVQSVGRLR